MIPAGPYQPGLRQMATMIPSISLGPLELCSPRWGIPLSRPYLLSILPTLEDGRQSDLHTRRRS